MLRNIPGKGIILSLIIFAFAFGRDGNWTAGFFMWLFFVIVQMPKSWRNLDF